MVHEEQQGDSVFTGGKRVGPQLGEGQESARKRIKMRDLNSVFRSEESSTHHPKSKDACDEQVSRITNVTVTLDLHASQLRDTRKATLPIEVSPVVSSLDLNRSTLEVNATPNCVEKHSQGPSARVIPIDLNAEDVTSSVNHPKSGDVSECGSTAGPAIDKDPLTRWREMKQNGFLSSPHRGLLHTTVASSSHASIPAPKQRAKKSKSSFLPKKMENTKRDQVDRFTKIAAPSGLLNGLNLGIINHVRNKKQVHSIIEALVRSERLENGHSQSKQACHTKCGPKEIMTTADSGKHQLGPSHGTGSFSASLAGNGNLSVTVSIGESDTTMFDKIGDRASISHHADVKEVESLKMKGSSLAKACEESSTFSNEESANTSSVSLLSARAANVAAQWLELLNQDIKGRLSALRRSKKRVRAVITTELPFLISKEFSSDQGKVCCFTNSSSDGLANNTMASMHLARWSKLFDQMDQALSEEEKQLESWLHDVREMQLHCDHGLQNFQWPGGVGSQHQGTLEYCTRIGQADRSTRELAVRAAAASIYSTCNSLVPKENVSCF